MKQKLQTFILATLIMAEALLTIDVCHEYLRLQSLQQAHRQAMQTDNMNTGRG